MTTRSRIVGSGFSTLMFNGKVIAMLDSFTDSGQAPIAAPETVYTLANGYAEEIATARVVAPGTLTVTIREGWHEPVWKTILQAAGIDAATAGGINDLVGAYNALDNVGDLTAQIVINNPSRNGGHRGKVFHGLVLTAIDDGEEVRIGTLTVPRTITFAYIKATYFSGSKSDPIPA